MTMRRWFPAWVLSLLLAACGGGGGGGTLIGGGSGTLPASLIVSAPTTQQALGAAVSFSANASNPELSYLWDFGDGSTSNAVAPTHVYARAGVFTVRLTLGNGSASISAGSSVAVADFAIVAGKSCNRAGNNGWCWQRPLPQGNFILDYAFVDDNRGWAVGQAGTVLATVDGGVTWNGQPSGTTLDISQAVFPNAMAGWLVSELGELLRTADGGASWRRVSYGRNDYVLALGASDADTAWLTTTLGAGFVTRDGGLSWRQVDQAPGGSFRIVFASATDVWSLPPFVDPQPTLGHSLDGGATWTTVALPPIATGFSGYSDDLLFVDPQHALVTGYESGFDPSDPAVFVSRRTVRLTADGGASWQTVQPPVTGSFFTFRLADATTVIAVDNNAVLRTRDNGTTWQAIPLPLGVMGLTGFQAFTAQRFVLADFNGKTWLSIDGGATWNDRSAGGVAQPTLNSVWFFDSREGLAIADDGSSVRTADGGKTWAAAASDTLSWYRLQFLDDASVGWLISLRGTIARSVDKGRTWTTTLGAGSASLNGVTDFHFVDALRGWAVAPFGSGAGTVFTTIDGGLTWQAVAATRNSQGFYAIRFADATHGVTVGPTGVAMVTSDGGATWAPRPTGAFGQLFSVHFADATTAVAVGEGGLIVRSTDAGQSWQPVASPTTRNLNDVRFVSPAIGHAVGNEGTLIVTRDGGATWTVVPTGTKAGLTAVFFRDEQTGWISGTNGSILATATGGH
ncbi:MAG: YCF48-related protein [Caldimonas sp.]